MGNLKEDIKEYQRTHLKKKEEPNLSFPKLAFRASIEMVSGIAVGVFIGYFVDQHYGTYPWMLLLGFILGSAAGFLNVWRSVKSMQEKFEEPTKGRSGKKDG